MHSLSYQRLRSALVVTAVWLLVGSVYAQADKTITGSPSGAIGATNSIVTSGTVTVSSATFQAGSQIKLEPGFTVSAGGSFHAFIAPDTTAPSQPIGLAASGMMQTSFTLSWTASTDAFGVTGYDVLKDGTVVTTVTNPTVDLTNLTQNTTYTMVVRARDAAGNTMSSASQQVTTVAATAPTFTMQPQSQSVGTSSTVTFTASASGDPSPSYQWRKNGGNIAGATSATLTLNNVQAPDAGTYSVVAGNVAGSATSANATLTVTAAPIITTQPQSQTIVPTGSVTFSVIATSGSALSYQWRKNGTNLSGQTAAALSLTNVQAYDTAYYDVIVTNSEGSVTSNPAGLIVAEAAGTGDGGTVPTTWPNTPKTPVVGDPAVGLTSGQLSVEKSGALTYSVPLWVVPGTAGMQPQLALNYSSQAGSGIAGFGWSLGGVSAISRGTQTRAVDNQVKGIEFTANDRYYLDGQRLIAISGADGANEIEYRTEIDSVSKIVSYGSGSSPSSFKMWTKAGLTIEFGTTANSAAEANNQGIARSEIMTWAVSKISDTAGNYMTFTYSEDQPNGEHRLTQIDYTGHGASTLPYATVKFTYEARPDVFRGYVAGSKVSNTKRLKTVESYYDDTTLVRKYTLDYVNRDLAPGDQLGRSVLKKLHEADGSGLEYSPLIFDYDSSGVGFTESSGWTPPALLGKYNSDGRGTGFVDLNGDGRPDFIQYRTNSSNGTVAQGAWINSVTSSGSHWVAAGSEFYPPVALAKDGVADVKTRLTDVNGDGFTDIFDGYGDCYTGSATGFGLNAAWCIPMPSASASYPDAYATYSKPAFIDLDGDGRPDFIAKATIHNLNNNLLNAVTPDGEATDSSDTTISVGKSDISTNAVAPPNTMQVEVAWLNKPDGWHEYSSYYPVLDMEKGSTFIDVNGDGLPDQVQYWRDQGTAIKNVVLNTGSGWGAPLGATSVFVPPEMLNEQTGNSSTAPVGTEFVDLNGDGLVDVVHRNDSDANSYAHHTSAWLNTGNGWVSAPTDFLPPFELTNDVTPKGVALLDINSDGFPDLVRAWGSERDVRLGSGQAWSGSAGAAGPTGYAPVRQLAQTDRPVMGTDFVDLDGDGAVDQVWSWSEGGDTANDAASGSAHGAALNLAKPAGRLNKVTNGFGVEVSVVYAPLTERDASGNFTVYDRGANPQAAAAATDIIAPLYVVKTVKNDDGAGTTHDVNYRYGGMRVHPKRGNLGFAVMTTTDAKTGIQTTTKFNQVFPYIGMPDSSETKSGTKLLSSTSTAYDVKSLNTGKTWLPYAQEVVQKSYELSSVSTDDGVFISGTKTTSVIDDDGNATQVSVVSINENGTPNGFSKTTDSIFAPAETTKWYLGRLTKSTVTAVAPNTPTLKRTSAFTYYDTTTGFLQDEIVEPKYKTDGTGAMDTDGDDTLRTHYVYDGFGNKQEATVTGVDFTLTGTKRISTRTTTTVYDPKGRFPDHSTNALGHTEIYGYDQKLGVMKSLQGPNGLTTSWNLDTFGNKTQESRADGTVTNIAVHWPGTDAPVGTKYFVETTGTGTPPTLVFHDKMGRVIRTASLDGNANILCQDTLYDDYGRAYAVSLPYRGGSSAAYWTQTTSYDLLSRPLIVQTPDDQNGTVSTKFAYKGLTTEVTDAKLRLARTVKNPQGWVTSSVRDVNGSAATVTTSYDAYGNPVSVTASASTTVMTYDTRGRKNGMTDPDMGGTAHPWSYGYNAFGELVSQTDAMGQTTRMSYDSLGRLNQRAESEGTTTWTYDTATHTSSPEDAPGTWVGKLASVSAPGGYSESYEYDGFGRPSKVVRNIDSAPYAVFQHYDSAGRPLVTVYPNGFQTKNVYNALGFLKEVRRTDGSTDGTGARLNPNLDLYWHADSYALDGRVNGETLGNGVTGDQVYSPATGRLLGAGVGLGTNNTVQFLAYVYDLVGNVTVRQDGTGNRQETFKYDTLDRLTNYALSGAADVDVDYDGNGNIRSKTGVGSYAYDGSHGGPHAVTSVTGGGLQSAASYQYDDNGNMTKRAGRTLTWTSFNQLKHVDDGNGHFSDFSFGAGHERVKQVAHNGTTIYVGGLWEKFTNGGSTLEKNYIMAPTGRIAVATFGNGLVVPGTVNYFHTDGLGSITAVSDTSGAVIQRFAFDAWGKRLTLDLNTLVPSPTTSSNNGYLTRGYTDHEQLDDLGLIHMNGRVYDPVLGRFLSADPHVDDPDDSQAFNRYSYCGNNPLGYTDPSGYFKLWKDLLKPIVDVVVAKFGMIPSFIYGYANGGMKEGIRMAAGSLGMFLGGPVGYSFASSFSSSLLNGGSIGDAFRAGVISGATTAVIQYIGAKFDGMGGNEYLVEAGRALAHGVAQGVSYELQGGEFRHGFYAGVSGSIAGSIAQSQGLDPITATVVAATIGGTISEIGGCKFANGAQSAAFIVMFNHYGDDVLAAGQGVALGIIEGFVWEVYYGVSTGNENMDLGRTVGRKIGAAAGLAKSAGKNILQQGLKAFSKAEARNLAKIGAQEASGDMVKMARKLSLNLASQTSRDILSNLNTPVEVFVGKYRLGKIWGELPSEYRTMTVKDALLTGGSKVRKLLTDGRFSK